MRPPTRSATRLAIKVGIKKTVPPQNTSAHRQKPAPQHHRPHPQHTTFRFPHQHPAAAGSGRNEHWRRTTISIARSAKAPSFPEPTCECRTDPAERATDNSKPPSPPTSHPHPAAAGPGRNEHWRRTTNSLAHSAKAPPPPSLPASAGPIPRSHQIRLAERERSATSLGGEQQKPSRNSAKAHPPPSLLSECRTDPAERRSIHSAPSKYRCNHSKIVACHSRLFCGFSTQCPSSGKYNNRLGTP